jgi:hypothetical protein
VERLFANTSPDWLLLLLNVVRPEIKENTLMLL